MNVENILGGLGIKVERELPTEWLARCPSGRHEDKHPSWSIRVKGGSEGKNFCQSCGFGGSIYSLIMHVRECTYVEAKKWLQNKGWVEKEHVEKLVFSYKTKKPSFQLPPEIQVDTPFSEWPGSMQEYVLSRGVWPSQIDQWGHGYALEGLLWGRVVLIVRDEDENPVSYMARTISSQQRRYMYPHRDLNPDYSIFFGQNRWPILQWRQDIVVTEGIFDAMAFERIAPSCALLALGGSRITPQLVLRLSTFRRVFLALDSDTTGQRCADQIENSLKKFPIMIKRINLPMGFDPASMSPGDLKGLMYG